MSPEAEKNRLVDNTILTIVARISMTLAIPVISILIWLVNDRFETRFNTLSENNKTSLTELSKTFEGSLASQSSHFQLQQQMMLNQLTEITKSLATAHANASSNQNRITILETNRTQDVVRFSNLETNMGQRYDRVQDALVELSNQVSSLTATIKAERGISVPLNGRTRMPKELR